MKRGRFLPSKSGQNTPADSPALRSRQMKIARTIRVPPTVVRAHWQRLKFKPGGLTYPESYSLIDEDADVTPYEIRRRKKIVDARIRRARRICGYDEDEKAPGFESAIPTFRYQLQPDPGIELAVPTFRRYIRD